MIYRTSVPRSRHAAWYPLGNLIVDVILLRGDPDVLDGAGDLAGYPVRAGGEGAGPAGAIGSRSRAG